MTAQQIRCIMPSDGRRSASEDVRDDRLSHQVIGCAIKVHRALGIGLVESAYEACFSYELAKEGLAVARQVVLPITYDGMRIDAGYKPDIIVNGELLLELKSVTQVLPIHEAQILTYLRLSGIERGLLMNFHSQPLSKGIRRFALSRLPP